MTNWSRFVERTQVTKDFGMVRCPCHNDSTASLSYRRKGDDVSLTCFASCPWREVRDAFGLVFTPDASPADVPVNAPNRRVVASYHYQSLIGDTIAIKERWEPKNFSWRTLRDDGQLRYGFTDTITLGSLPVYGLPLAHATVTRGRSIHCVEGEKSADALIALGMTAICGPEGASGAASAYDVERYQHWLPRGAVCYLWPDRDAPGEKHMARLAQTLLRVGAVVHMVPNAAMPEKGDVYDLVTTWRNGGQSDEQIAGELGYMALHAPPALIPTTDPPLPVPDDVAEAITERAAIYAANGWPDAVADAVAAHQGVTRHTQTLAAMSPAERLAYSCTDLDMRDIYLELSRYD